MKRHLGMTNTTELRALTEVVTRKSRRKVDKSKTSRDSIKLEANGRDSEGMDDISSSKRSRER